MAYSLQKVAKSINLLMLGPNLMVTQTFKAKKNHSRPAKLNREAINHKAPHQKTKHNPPTSQKAPIHHGRRPGRIALSVRFRSRRQRGRTITNDGAVISALSGHRQGVIWMLLGA